MANQYKTGDSVLLKYNIETIATNLPEFKTIAPPPRGFDPFKATADELHKHHLPHRPDPRTSMAAAKTWRKAMSRIHRYVAPQLKLRNRKPRPSLGNPAARAKHGTSSGWAGIVATEGSFTQVWGIFVYPHVVVPHGAVAQPVSNGDPNYTFNAWIGLDGTDGSGDVCQAGIETDLFVDSNGNITNSNTYAWIEWYPLGTVVENFSLSPGDTVAVLIQYLGLDNKNQFNASVHFSNLTTGVTVTPIVLTVPYNTLKKDNALFQGNTAEWIVEPTAYTDNIYSSIADFGDLIFIDAGALSQPGGAKGSVVDASKETQETNIVVNNATVASELSTPALQISYLATAGSNEQPGYEYPL